MPAAAPRSRPAPKPTVQLLVRIAPSLKERVSRLSRRRAVFETRIIEEALTQYLETREK